jgi:hypothetical protein
MRRSSAKRCACGRAAARRRRKRRANWGLACSTSTIGDGRRERGPGRRDHTPVCRQGGAAGRERAPAPGAGAGDRTAGHPKKPRASSPNPRRAVCPDQSDEWRASGPAPVRGLAQRLLCMGATERFAPQPAGSAAAAQDRSDPSALPADLRQPAHHAPNCGPRANGWAAIASPDSCARTDCAAGRNAATGCARRTISRLRPTDWLPCPSRPSRINSG